jgi:hypothetical protein
MRRVQVFDVANQTGLVSRQLAWQVTRECGAHRPARSHHNKIAVPRTMLSSPTHG